MEEYSISDHSGLSALTSKYYRPENTAHLSDFLKENSTSKFRIGGGLTGVNGGAVPTENEFFIDLTRINHVSWKNQDSGILEVEAGATIEDIQKYLKNTVWFLPATPGNLKASIGGLIACNGGGPDSLKYGKIGSSVLSINALKSNGENIKFGGYATKISEGINYTSLLVGSEGTLAIITKVLLRCRRKSKEIFNYRFEFNSFNNLLDSLSVFSKQNPVFLEAAEKEALKFSNNYDKHLVWMSTNSKNLIEEVKGLNFEIVSNQTIIDERFAIGYGIQKYKPFIDLDVSFSLENSIHALKELKYFLNNFNIENIFFGHAGDGNWHIHIFKSNDIEDLKGIIRKFDDIVKKYNGFISGEHGIGRIHKDRFLANADSTEKEIYTALKNSLDPFNQLPSFY